MNYTPLLLPLDNRKSGIEESHFTDVVDIFRSRRRRKDGVARAAETVADGDEANFADANVGVDGVNAFDDHLLNDAALQ